MIFREEQKHILQVMLYDEGEGEEEETKSMVVSKVGCPTKAHCIARSFPGGLVLFDFEFSYKNYRNIVLTCDSLYFIGYGSEAFKETLFTFHADTGERLHKVQVKYPNFKEINMIVTLPDKPGQIALIDQEKGRGFYHLYIFSHRVGFVNDIAKFNPSFGQSFT